jgi:hypothetical protein
MLLILRKLASSKRKIIILYAYYFCVDNEIKIASRGSNSTKTLNFEQK